MSNVPSSHTGGNTWDTKGPFDLASSISSTEDYLQFVHEAIQAHADGGEAALIEVLAAWETRGDKPTAAKAHKTMVLYQQPTRGMRLDDDTNSESGLSLVASEHIYPGASSIDGEVNMIAEEAPANGDAETPNELLNFDQLENRLDGQPTAFLNAAAPHFQPRTPQDPPHLQGRYQANGTHTNMFADDVYDRAVEVSRSKSDDLMDNGVSIEDSWEIPPQLADLYTEEVLQILSTSQTQDIQAAAENLSTWMISLKNLGLKVHYSSCPLFTSGETVPSSTPATAGWYSYLRDHDLPIEAYELRLIPDNSMAPVLLNKSEGHVMFPTFPLTARMQTSLLNLQLSLLPQDGHMSQFPGRDRPICIFVDMSNITISWMNCQKERHGLPMSYRMKQSPFCFPHLHKIMARGRPTEIRFAAGSSSTDVAPHHAQEAEFPCGYTVRTMPRIAVNTPFGKGASKKKEHFVDECIQHAMLGAIYDHNPATMVVATGDGNEAEYAEGFFKNIERALDKGWYVELVAFKQSISKMYRETAFQAKWGHRFRIIELDEFSDLLYAMWLSG